MQSMKSESRFVRSRRSISQTKAIVVVALAAQRGFVRDRKTSTTEEANAAAAHSLTLSFTARNEMHLKNSRTDGTDGTDWALRV